MRLNYGRTGCRGIVYDGTDLTDYFQVVDVSIPLLPSMTAYTYDLAQKPGSYFASKKMGTRSIKLKLRLDAGSRDPTAIFREWRRLSGLFNKEEPKRLQLNEELYCWALPVGDTEIEDEAYYGVVEFEFMCFDPFFYGKTHEVELSDGVSLTFTVQGACPAYPTFDLTATATTVDVRNMVTGEYVRTDEATSGSSVEIDMEMQSTELDGDYCPVYLYSDYFSIEGEVEVKVTGASGTMEYQERYL